jgi:hypothetical protein
MAASESTSRACCRGQPLSRADFRFPRYLRVASTGSDSVINDWLWSDRGEFWSMSTADFATSRVSPRSWISEGSGAMRLRVP